MVTSGRCIRSVVVIVVAVVPHWHVFTLNVHSYIFKKQSSERQADGEEEKEGERQKIPNRGQIQLLQNDHGPEGVMHAT